MESEPVVGQCYIVNRNDGRHNAAVGSRLVVSHVDSRDHTVRGFLDSSKTGFDGWVPRADIEPVGFGWDFVRRHLPPDIVTLLSACDHVEALSLSEGMRQTVLGELPDLMHRITDAVREIEAEEVHF
jgi:hypothetical protein